MRDRLSLRHELQRKIIHFSTSVIPILYFFYLRKEQIAVFCIILSMGFLTVDLLRYYNEKINTLFRSVFVPLLRDKERTGQLTGATLLFIGISLSVLFFPKKAAVTAMLFVTLADPVAALVGKFHGRIKLWNKTLEGSLGFLLVAVTLTFVFWGINWQGILISFVITGIEVLPIPVNDNISIPVSSGILLHYLY